MGTKQVKMDFLIVADDQASATVTIKVDGVEKWSGNLANTNDTIPGPDTPDAPYSVVEFDLELPAASSPWLKSITTENLTFTVARGSAILKHILTNYSVTAPDPATTPPTLIGGNASIFVGTSYVVAQPTWNGVPLLDRYNIDVASQPGPMLFETGEILEFPCAIQNYNDQMPPPA